MGEPADVMHGLNVGEPDPEGAAPAGRWGLPDGPEVVAAGAGPSGRKPVNRFLFVKRIGIWNGS